MLLAGHDTQSPVCDTQSEISPESCHPHWGRGTHERGGGREGKKRRGRRDEQGGGGGGRRTKVE